MLIMIPWFIDLIMCRKQPGIASKGPMPYAGTYSHTIIILYVMWSIVGRLCEKCDGKCVICDSCTLALTFITPMKYILRCESTSVSIELVYTIDVRPSTLVRVCDECNYGSYQGRCVICGGKGISVHAQHNACHCHVTIMVAGCYGMIYRTRITVKNVP